MYRISPKSRQEVKRNRTVENDSEITICGQKKKTFIKNIGSPLYWHVLQSQTQPNSDGNAGKEGICDEHIQTSSLSSLLSNTTERPSHNTHTHIRDWAVRTAHICIPNTGDGGRKVRSEITDSEVMSSRPAELHESLTQKRRRERREKGGAAWEHTIFIVFFYLLLVYFSPIMTTECKEMATLKVMLKTASCCDGVNRPPIVNTQQNEEATLLRHQIGHTKVHFLRGESMHFKISQLSAAHGACITGYSRRR